MVFFYQHNNVFQINKLLTNNKNNLFIDINNNNKKYTTN